MVNYSARDKFRKKILHHSILFIQVTFCSMFGVFHTFPLLAINNGFCFGKKRSICLDPVLKKIWIFSIFNRKKHVLMKHVIQCPVSLNFGFFHKTGLSFQLATINKRCKQNNGKAMEKKIMIPNRIEFS